MGEWCKDCEDREKCLSAKKVGEISNRLIDTLEDWEPSSEVIVALLCLVCVVAKSIDMPPALLAKALRLALAMHTDSPSQPMAEHSERVH